MTDDFCCHGCGYPEHTTLAKACPWCRANADRITDLEAEVARLTAIVEAYEDMAPPPEPGALRAQLRKRAYRLIGLDPNSGYAKPKDT